MKNKCTMTAAVLWLLLCAPAGYAAASAATGAEVQRIVSLGPALTEDLYLLNSGDRLVGCTIYCLRPPEARKKTRVGTVVEVSVEKIVQLKPDLVLATELTDRRSVEKLKSLGIRVVVFGQPRTFAEICSQFLDLGRLVGRERAARAIVTGAEKEAGRIRVRTGNLTRPLVFVELGTKPLFTATEDSFINDLILMAGGKNIAAGAGIGFYSREAVIKADPDVILIPAMEAGTSPVEEWRKFPGLKAVRGKRIHLLDPYLICSPTPPGFIQALKEIARLLHPEVFKRI